MVIIKIFISQPMGGRSDKAVLSERESIIFFLTHMTPYYYANVEFIDSWLNHCDRGPVWCLGESIKLMQDADLVVFAPEWQKARGCRIEHQVCEDYGIDIMEI